MSTPFEEEMLTQLRLLNAKMLSLMNGQDIAAPIDTSYTIANDGSTVTQGFPIDYKRRKHLYVFSPTAFTLNLNEFGNLAIDAQTWTELPYKEGLKLYPTTTLAATNILVRATDETISGAESATATAASSSVNVAQVAGVAPNLAKETSGNLAAILLDTADIELNTAPILAAQLANNALLSAPFNNNASVPTGAANTVIKASAGVIGNVVVTTAGTGAGNVIIFDNATTNAGTQLFAFPATVVVGTTFQFIGWALVGMTAQNVLNGPVFTVFFS